MKGVSDTQLIYLARFIKTHGYKGELTLKLNPEFIKLPKTELLFVEIDGIAVPFFIAQNGIKQKGKNYTLKLDGIGSDTRAEEIKNCPILLPKSYFSDEQIFDELSYLNGFLTYDKDTELGAVINVQRIPNNPLLEVRNISGTTFLIPFNAHFITTIDKQNKAIYFNLPEGLIELNRK